MSLQFSDDERETDQPTPSKPVRFRPHRASHSPRSEQNPAHKKHPKNHSAHAKQKKRLRLHHISYRIKQFVRQHKPGFTIVIVLLLMSAFMLDVFSSCVFLADGIGYSITASTYASKDEVLLGTEEAYCAMEKELQKYLDRFEQTHNYDEYRYVLDEINHDPYVLNSMLSALHPGEWALSDVAETLDLLFEMQYRLTEQVTIQTRYHLEEDGTRTPYEHRICTIILEATDLSRIPSLIMDEEQLGMYAVYMATLGNRPDLFPNSSYIGRYGEDSYLKYDVPPNALKDEVFAAMLEEAEKYLGYPYVWGGSNPSTSFDCSGFVSWVINHSGWDVGRCSAQALLELCTPITAANARPGDLIFFENTYDTPGASHVGIYVGNQMMLHCGDPISYATIDTSYWQSHFLCFGSLP